MHVLRPIIEVKDLEFSYEPGKPVLRGINLDIYEGEFVAIIGQNGSGKTTLVKHFNGLLKPGSGKIIIDGTDTQKASTAQLAAKVGYVFQNPDHQLCCKTVEEELSLGPINIGLPAEEIENKVNKVLKIFDLDKLRNEHPLTLSKADRLRVALCSVLIMEPKILIVDEPTTGQDMQQSYMVMDVLKGLNERGHTIIFITHNMQMVAEYAKRTIVMGLGEIILDGPTDKVFSKPETLQRTYLKPPQITQVAISLSERGIPISRRILTVEQAYKALISLVAKHREKT